jgi:hypothetical protein
MIFANAVEADGKKYDAFKLAKDCIVEWISYLRSKGLLTQKSPGRVRPVRTPVLPQRGEDADLQAASSPPGAITEEPPGTE